MTSVETVTGMIGLYTLNIASAIVIFVIGKWVVGKVSGIANKLMLKNEKVDITLAKFLEVYYLLCTNGNCSFNSFKTIRS